LGNYILETTQENAKVFRYGIASKYLKKDSENNVWTVVASFDLKLNILNGTCRVGKMKLDMKFIEGNIDLPKHPGKESNLLTNHGVLQRPHHL